MPESVVRGRCLVLQNCKGYGPLDRNPTPRKDEQSDVRQPLFRRDGQRTVIGDVKAGDGEGAQTPEAVQKDQSTVVAG